jgi:hypothetical protein
MDMLGKSFLVFFESISHSMKSGGVCSRHTNISLKAYFGVNLLEHTSEEPCAQLEIFQQD